MLRVILDQMPRKHRKVIHSMFPLNIERETKEKTLWICCFLNYETKVAEFLKTGTMVHVYGEITVGIFKRDTGDTVPSVTMSVDKVQLLSSKNKE